MPNSITLPAGRYYLGDPCYVFANHEMWDHVLDNSDFLENFLEFGDSTPLLGRGFVAASGTQYGDGEYQSTYHGARLGVDAGLIGLVSQALVERHCDADEMARIWDPKAGPAPEHYLGVWVDFDEPFTFTQKDSDGTIVAGHIEIYTGDDPDEDFDDEDEDQED